ncbi:unnamed protein product [Rotaria sordida]|uniref:Uncharacterized protein n=1 Tax=Rotaria sordida TaxID=392033 RepID=A0A819WAR6_9BILA|nr:unnamed protein product [Rotaria sordida]CAF1511304.1 unnamed protein product [Rotaria sordida]CAF4122930.1 unnamed protein product [Rotaria sordida]
MNENSVANCAISVENSVAKQYLLVDNEQRENSTQNQSNSTKFANDTNKMKTSPMTPTYLEYSWWPLSRSLTLAGAFAILTIITMVTSVVIVCFTSSKVIGMFFFIDI